MSPFTKTLLAGAATAASLPLTVLALGPGVGPGRALSLHVVFAVALWVGSLATGARRRLGVATGVAVAGALAALLAGSVPGLLLGLGAIAAVVRMASLEAGATPRALAIEAFVLALSTGASALVAGPGLVASALATWAWFVAQSVAHVVARPAMRRRRERPDPFEEARNHLDELLAP